MPCGTFDLFGNKVSGMSTPSGVEVSVDEGLVVLRDAACPSWPFVVHGGQMVHRDVMVWVDQTDDITLFAVGSEAGDGIAGYHAKSIKAAACKKALKDFREVLTESGVLPKPEVQPRSRLRLLQGGGARPDTAADQPRQLRRVK